MIDCERCKELTGRCNDLEKEIRRLTLKIQNARKWELAKAPLQEYLKLVNMIYMRLIDKFAILNNGVDGSQQELASLAVTLSEALYDELYNKKERME